MRQQLGCAAGLVSVLVACSGAPADPPVKVAQTLAAAENVEAQRTLNNESIRRTIRRRLDEVKICYEEALARRPTLAGRVLVRLAIGTEGAVTSSEALPASTLGDPQAEACIALAIRQWEFPKPAGGGTVVVSYPFTFAPTGIVPGRATPVSQPEASRQ